MKRNQPKSTAACDVTRARIVQAALDLFSEHGFDAATTAAIAKRAGVTEKTLFRHFGNKKKLFAKTVYPAILELLRPIAFESLRAVIQTDQPTLRQSVRAIMMDRIAFTRKRPEMVKLLAQELLLHSEFRGPFIKFWRENILQENLKMLQRAKRRGELRGLPPLTVLRATISVTAGYCLSCLIFEPKAKWNDAKVVDGLCDILMHGISASPIKEEKK